MSHDETERRGWLYDLGSGNQSSQFGLCDDLGIDAGNMCNEMRFMNNSKNGNVKSLKASVNGEERVGFFAEKDIRAQTEMTFDYGDEFHALTEALPEPPNGEGAAPRKRGAEPDQKPKKKKKKKRKPKNG